MTIAFVLGVLQTFVANRDWTFRFRDRSGQVAVRYAAVYIAAYALNLAALDWFVERLGYKHYIVQGCMIMALAVMLFLAQKLWVFRT